MSTTKVQLPPCYGSPTYGNPCRQCLIRGACHGAQKAAVVLLRTPRIVVQEGRTIGARFAAEHVCDVCGPSPVYYVHGKRICAGGCKREV